MRFCPGSKRTAVPAAMLRRMALAPHRAVECQRRVRLRKVVMRADLDRAVAGIRDSELRVGRPALRLDVAAGGKNLSWDHGIG